MTGKHLEPSGAELGNGVYIESWDAYDLTKLEQIAEALWGVGRAADMLAGKPDKGHYDKASDKQKGAAVDYLVNMIGQTAKEECTAREFMINSLAVNLLKVAGY